MQKLSYLHLNEEHIVIVDGFRFSFLSKAWVKRTVSFTQNLLAFVYSTSCLLHWKV